MRARNGMLTAEGCRAWVGWPRELPAVRGRDELELNLVLEGSLTYRVGGSRLRLPAGRLCAFWGGMRRQAAGSLAGVRLGWVTLPLKRMLEDPCPAGVCRIVLAGGVLTEPRPDPADEPALIRWAGDLSSNDARRRDVTALEIHARLNRFLLGRPKLLAPGSKRYPTPLSQSQKRSQKRCRIPFSHPAVQEMMHYLNERFRGMVRVDDLAAHVGLHPNYAMTLFRRVTGMTLLDYLARQRVLHAQHLLATTDRDVPMIAGGCGFGSVSRFYAAFRRECGQTPRGFRKAVG